MNSTKTYLGAALIAVGTIMFWMLTLPAYDQVMNLRSALADRNSILDNRTAIINNIKTLTKQYADRSADIQRFSNLVPADKGTAELVSTIEAMANQSGITLTGLSLAGSQNPTQNAYVPQPIDMSLTGTYPSFRTFLSLLETNLRIMDVISMNINQTTVNSSNLGFQIKANAYYLK